MPLGLSSKSVLPLLRSGFPSRAVEVIALRDVRRTE